MSAAAERPTFADRYDYSACHSSYAAVTAADFNGDGVPDLLCADGFEGVVTLLGNGDGTFRKGPFSSFGYYVQTPVSLDLNGDGITDIGILADNGSQHGILVAFGNGDGTFRFSGFYPTGTDTSIEFIVAGDFNGDGVPELATEGESGVWLLVGQGGGIFDQASLIPVSSHTTGNNELLASDINGDGNLDIVVIIDNGFAVLLGNGSGTFQPQIDTSAQMQLTAFAVGDLDGDGKPDLFASSAAYKDGFAYFGEGNGTFTPPRLVSIESAPYSVAIADINGDGFADVITSGGDIVFGNGRGHFAGPEYYLTFNNHAASYVLPYDLLNNDRIDLIFSNYMGGFDVLLNDNKGKIEDGLSVPMGVEGSAYCAASADFNGDGNPDLAVTVDQGIYILLGTGTAASPFTPGQTLPYQFDSSFRCPVIGDFNNDGVDDLLVTSSSRTAITFLGNGDGTFIQLAQTTPLSSDGILALGDFNDDGNIDFALSSNQLAYGNGDGTFQTPAPFIPHLISKNISSIAVGRLRGNRETDIVLTDSVANLVYVLLSDGNNGFTQATFNSAADGDCEAPVYSVLADVNGDGFKDLVLGCNGPAVPIYLNDGSGVLSFSGISLSGGVNKALPFVADLNGDGIADVVVQNDANLTIFPGEGSLAFGPPVTIGTGPFPVHVLAADAHGQRPSSGKPDLIVPDGSGVVNVYFNTTK